MAYPIEKEKQIETSMRPGQSPDAKKQADAMLVYEQDKSNLAVAHIEDSIKAQTSTVDEFQGVEIDTHKGFFEKQREGLKSSVGNGFEWLGSGVANAAGRALETDVSRSAKIATGVGIAGVVGYLGYKAWKRWKGDSEENKEKPNNDDKKESKEGILNSIGGSIRGLVKKVALRGGGALAATYLASYFLKGKSLSDLIDQFLERIGWNKKPEGKADNTDAGDATAVEDANQGFEKEKPGVQAAFNEIGINTNSLYTTAGVSAPSILGQADFEKLDNNAGVIPYMLNGRYKTFGDFIGEQGIASESRDMDIGQMKDWLKKSFTDKSVEYIKNFLGGFAGLIDKVSFGFINSQTTVENIISKLQSDPNYDMIVKYAFHKSKMVHSYLQNRRTALETKLKAEGKTESEIKSIIQDRLLSQAICTFDDAGNLVGGAYQYIKSQGVEVVKKEDINEDVKTNIEESDKEKQGYLETIKTLRDKKEKGTLTNQEVQELCEDLSEVCDDISEDYAEFATLPIMKMFGDEDAAVELYNNGPLKPMVEQFKTSLKKIHNLGANATVADFDDLSKKTEELYEFHQALILSSWEMEESKDANGNTKAKRTLRTKNYIKATGSNILTGFEMIGQGEWLKGSSIIAGAALPPLMILTSTGRKVTRKLTKGTVMTGVKIGRRCKGGLGYGSLKYYNTASQMKFTKDVLRGKISPERVKDFAIQMKIGGKTSFGSIDDVIDELLSGHSNMTQAQKDFVKANREIIGKDKRLAKEIFGDGKKMSSTIERFNPRTWIRTKDTTHLVINTTLIDELIKLNPSGKLINTLTSSLNNLAPEAKTILTKTGNEIKALELELKQLKATHTVGTKAVRQEIRALQALETRIQTLGSKDASVLLKAMEKISLRTLATFTGKFKDTNKIGGLLEDIIKGTDDITEVMIRNKLIALGEHNAAKLFRTPSSFTKTFVAEAKAIRLEKTLMKTIVGHLDEAIKIIAKLFGKLR